MQFERLVIDADNGSFTLEFHPRLTVLAGLGQLEREGLVNELVGALGSGRSGVHLEMMSDAGNRYAIFRPEGGRHRVVDIDAVEDVSPRFRDAQGRVDLLTRAGLDPHSAKGAMRVKAQDLLTSSQEERSLHTLARVEQGRLWDLATKVIDREHHLQDESDASGSAPEDAEIIERIEALHRTAERAAEEHERVRSWTLWLSFAAIMVALPLAFAAGPMPAAPFILTALGSGGFSWSYYRRAEAARSDEEAALADVGANNYLNFHLHRVNRLLGSDSGRQRLMSAAEEHRAALAQWRLLAGEIPVQWALDRREAIQTAAAELRAGQGIGRVVATGPEVAEDVIRELGAGLRARLGELRKLGPGGESFPALLDEPFVDVLADAMGPLLDLVAESATRQQVILLTENPAVTDWARHHAGDGSIRLIEPAGARERLEPHGEGGSATAHPRHRPHVAA